MSSAASEFLVSERVECLYTQISRSRTHVQEVPDSCIQSAEYIIQCFSNGATHEWSSEDHDPHVFAHFKNKVIDITHDEHWLENDSNGLTDYDLRRPLVCGEGITFVHRIPVTKGNERPYYMHFMAVVATGTFGGQPAVRLSNHMEKPRKGDPPMVALKTFDTTDWIGLRNVFFGEHAGEYAVGLLTVSPGRDQTNAGGNLRRNSLSRSGSGASNSDMEM